MASTICSSALAVDRRPNPRAELPVNPEIELFERKQRSLRANRVEAHAERGGPAPKGLASAGAAVLKEISLPPPRSLLPIMLTFDNHGEAAKAAQMRGSRSPCGASDSEGRNVSRAVGVTQFMH